MLKTKDLLIEIMREPYLFDGKGFKINGLKFKKDETVRSPYTFTENGKTYVF